RKTTGLLTPGLVRCGKATGTVRSNDRKKLTPSGQPPEGSRTRSRAGKASVRRASSRVRCCSASAATDARGRGSPSPALPAPRFTNGVADCVVEGHHVAGVERHRLAFI